jgi:hypothetical protein
VKNPRIYNKLQDFSYFFLLPPISFLP